MKFHEALKECVENGKPIWCKSWNGRNMFVIYQAGGTIKTSALKSELVQKVHEEKGNSEIEIAGHFDMYNAQGKLIIGWVASQTDMASDMWVAQGVE